MTTELKTIPFAGGEIEAAVGPSGKPFVNIRRMCEELGLDPNSQARKLKNAEWATTVEMTVVASDGKERTMSFLDARAVPMWAATIQAGKVAAELQPRLREYQLQAAEVLAQAFMPQASVVHVDGALAKMAAVQSALAATIQQLTSVSEVVVEHEHRLRALEAKPVVTVTMSKTLSLDVMRTRFHARLGEEAAPFIDGKSPAEVQDFFRELNVDMNRHLQMKSRSNWEMRHFLSAIEWLKTSRYQIDISDIAVGVTQ